MAARIASLPTMMRLSLLMAGVGVASAELFFVGSGGCDVLDHGCVDDPKNERLIGAVQVDATGALSWPQFERVDAGGIPSWLVTDGDCTWAALHDTNRVASFRHDDGALALVASEPSGGKTPLYMELSPDRQLMLIANYAAPDDGTNSSGASVAAFSRRDGCGLTLEDSAAVDAPSHVDPDGRQGASHIHSVVLSHRLPGIAFACDLGGDRIYAFRYDGSGRLRRVGSAASPPGAGPRHAREHPSHNVLYVLHEMGSFLQAWSFSEDSGELEFEPGPIVSLLPSAPSNRSKAAELLLRGNYIFATVRGEDSAVVSVDVSEPLKPFVASRRTEDVDAFPRGAAFASSGTLLVAGQHGSTVASFSVGESGALEHEATLAGSVPPFPAAFAPA